MSESTRTPEIPFPKNPRHFKLPTFSLLRQLPSTPSLVVYIAKFRPQTTGKYPGHSVVLVPPIIMHLIGQRFVTKLVAIALIAQLVFAFYEVPSLSNKQTTMNYLDHTNSTDHKIHKIGALGQNPPRTKTIWNELDQNNLERNTGPKRFGTKCWTIAIWTKSNAILMKN